VKIYTKSKNIFLRNRLNKYFEKILQETGNNLENIAVGIKFVDGKEIQQLNKEFRNVDKVTDVLSFPMFEIKAGQKIEKVLSKLDVLESEIYLGDIVICKDKVFSQAKEFGISKKKELYYLAVHSFLHLLGYDHQTPAQEKKMYGFAEKILGYGR